MASLLSLPKTTMQICLHKCLNSWGGNGLDLSSLDYLQETQELGEEAKVPLYFGTNQEESRLIGADAWI